MKNDRIKCDRIKFDRIKSERMKTDRTKSITDPLRLLLKILKILNGTATA
jgi:hypothetical protein